MTRNLRVFYLAQNYIAYDSSSLWQSHVSEEVRCGAPEALALLQHAPVYTLGRRPRYEHLLRRPLDLQVAGAEVVESDRGGDVTYHGPGQLVGYPILNLRTRGLGPKKYVHTLEAVLIETLDRFGITAERVEGRPGVWVGNDKVAAIGVRLESGVTTHGFALNVTTDLERYDAIVPCGLRDAGVTSIQHLLGRAPFIDEVADVLLEVFERTFDCRTTSITRELEHKDDRELALAHGG